MGSLRASFVSLVLVCVMITVLCEPATSQSKRGKRQIPVTPSRTELVLTEPVPPRKVGQASVSYDVDSNETQVVVSLKLRTQPKNSPVELFSGFLISGKELIKPAFVHFRFTTTHGVPQGLFKGRPAVEFSAGGSVFRLDKPKRERLHSLDGGYDQVISGNLPFAQFEQMAGNDQIKGRAGSLLFVLSDTDRDALRDLLKAAAGVSFDK